MNDIFNKLISKTENTIVYYDLILIKHSLDKTSNK